MIKRQMLFVLLVALFVSSCINLARRFKSHDNHWIGKWDVQKYVKVSAETYNISEIIKSQPAAKDLFSLTPEGQAELIKAVAGKTKKVEELLAGISKKLSSETSSTVKAKVFPMTISKSIVFSVDRRWASEGYREDRRIINRIADRLSNLEMSVNIPENSLIIFDSWDKFVTDWVTVDLGKVASSQQWSATANINASLSEKLTSTNKSSLEQILGTKTGKADISQIEKTDSEKTGSEGTDVNETSKTIGPSANINFTDKFETSLNLLLSRMKLSGTLSKEKITLRQEGAFGVDLSGNTSISVDYTFTGQYAAPITILKISQFYRSDTALPATTITKNKIIWLFPNITNHVTAAIQYKYLYRFVRNQSKKHIPEARQKVDNYYGEVGYGDVFEGYSPAIALELVKPEDFKPATYRIGTRTPFAIRYLRWDGDIIEFETPLEAASFLEYIIVLSKSTRAYGTITGIPFNNDLSSFGIIRHQH